MLVRQGHKLGSHDSISQAVICSSGQSNYPKATFLDAASFVSMCPMCELIFTYLPRWDFGG